MVKDKKVILIVILGLIVLVGIGYYIYADSKKEETEMGNIASSTAISLEGSILNSLAEQGIKDVEIEILPPEDSTIPVPDLDSEVIFSSSFPEEAVQILRDNIENTRSFLRKDPNLVNDWILLGTQYKVAEDFDKTIEAWNYVGFLSPNNSVSFHNLGDLYGYYLKDVQEAEENFLRAISNAPNDIYLYFKTADFYKDIMKDEVKRRAIVEQGLEANPDSPDLKNLLNSF